MEGYEKKTTETRVGEQKTKKNQHCTFISWTLFFFLFSLLGQIGVVQRIRGLGWERRR